MKIILFKAIMKADAVSFGAIRLLDVKSLTQVVICVTNVLHNEPSSTLMC